MFGTAEHTSKKHLLCHQKHTALDNAAVIIVYAGGILQR